MCSCGTPLTRFDTSRNYRPDLCWACMTTEHIRNPLPFWPGASQAYKKAYMIMDKHGANHHLIDALNKGEEETIKGILLTYTCDIDHALDMKRDWD